MQDTLKFIRRKFIVGRKRFEFLKYSVRYKMGRGNLYDLNDDVNNLRTMSRSINLLDFSKDEDFFLVDECSDATQYGGLSETILEHNTEQQCLTVKSKFQRIAEGFALPTDIMFSGFECQQLFKHEFDNYNGIRVTMRQPPYPCKLGLHIKVSIGNEHELYMGHIVDTVDSADELGPWREYELPIDLLHNQFVVSKLVHPAVDDQFEARGLVFMAESDRPSTATAEREYL